MASSNHQHQNPNNHHNKSSNRKSGRDSNSSEPKHIPVSNPNPSSNPNHTNFYHKNPTPTHQQPDPFPYSDRPQLVPTPQPAYGFHMLLRRTIVFADGTVRSYFALPPEYEEFSNMRMSPLDGRGREKESQDYWNSLGLDNVHVGRGVGDGLGLKRKFGDEKRVDMRNANDREYLRQRQQLVQYGNVKSTRNLDHLGGASERNDRGSRRDSEELPIFQVYESGFCGDLWVVIAFKASLGWW